MYFINKIKAVIIIIAYLFLYTYLIIDNVYAFNIYNIHEIHYYTDDNIDINTDIENENKNISINNVSPYHDDGNYNYNGEENYFIKINHNIKNIKIKENNNNNNDNNDDYLYVLYIISKENKYIYKNYPELSKFIAYKIVQASHDNRFKRFGLNQKSLLFLLLGIIKIESNFHPVALSYANAAGLMQIHIPTWKIKYNDAYNIEFNIFMGKEILYHYMELNNGSIKLALFRYLGASNYSYAINVLTKANNYMKQHKIFVQEMK